MIHETYSKRQKRLAQAGTIDMYHYDQLPKELRIQIVHIFESYNEAVQGHSDTSVYGFWKTIHNSLCREIGVFHLEGPAFTPFQDCRQHVLNGLYGSVIDLLDLAFNHLEVAHGFVNYDKAYVYSVKNAIQELNYRFQEHAIGYRFENGQIVRIDSELVHSEMTKPALTLLSIPGFEGAQEEFLTAHKHYREGRQKEAMNEALKAFESCMKSIAALRGWRIEPGRSAAGHLIKMLSDKGLFAGYTNSYLTQLRAMLETGVPTIRNNASGHGQGDEPTRVPNHVVAYTLHLTAANIVFLVEQHRALPLLEG